jgi:hypothetical protein
MNEVRGPGDAGAAGALLQAGYEYSAFYGSMLLFGLLCLSCSLLALPLYALLPRRRAIACGGLGIMAGFRLYIRWLALLIRNGSALQKVREAVSDLRHGAVLLLFPEGTRTESAPVNRFKKSIGVSAKHARVPVQTLIIDTDSPLLRKGWRFGMRPALPISDRLRLGRRFDPSPDVDAFVAELERHYRNELPAGGLARRIGGGPTCH